MRHGQRIFLFSTLYMLVSCGAKTLLPPDAILPDGSQYHGDVVNGLFEGVGVQTFPDGTVYEGEFHQGIWHGEGTLTNPDDWVYIGRFAGGMFSGQGKLVLQNETYEGAFSDNKYEGQGTLTFASDDRYQGAFKSGLLDGEGEYYYADGSVITGVFSEGEPSKGKLTSELGVYEGGFSDWLYQGEGRYQQTGGGLYQGHFENGVLQGSGAYSDDEESYRGEFVNWVYHGEGVLTHADGNVIAAPFRYGWPEGQGTLTTTTADGEKSRQRGRWENGEFIADGEPPAVVLREQTVQRILSENDQRLAAQLAALREQIPGESDVYFLAVGGDGHEAVFGRDIEVAKQGVAKVFDIEGRSISLLNDRTYRQYPLATPAHVISALQALDQKMDSDEDLLFIHLVSHGGRNGDFLLSQPGMSLPDLTPSAFAEAIQSLRVRKKVLVVSACYSGQWLDQLKSDDLIMLMSARRDRTSFGCGDDSEMTWFTKATYQEVGIDLDDPEKWFARVDETIRQWEVEREFSEEDWSHPQYFAGAEITAWLNDLRRSTDL